MDSQSSNIDARCLKKSISFDTTCPSFSPDSVASMLQLSPRPTTLEEALAALERAHAVIQSQARELQVKSQRISVLESAMQAEFSKLDIDSSTPTAASGVGWLLDRTGRRRTNSDKESSLSNSGRKLDLEISVDRAEKVQCEQNDSVASEAVPTGCPHLPASAFVTPKNAENTTLRSSRAGSFSCPPEIASQEDGSAYQAEESRDHCDGDAEDRQGAPKALADRLSMGVNERRKLARTTSSDKLKRLANKFRTDSSPQIEVPKTSLNRSTSAPVCAAAATLTPVLSSLTPVWPWDNSSEEYLFIVHDNPQLGSSVSSFLGSGGSSGSVAPTPTSRDRRSPGICLAADALPSKGRAAAMGVMMESKDEKGRSYFVMGNIVYSGSISEIENANIDCSRGSLCLVCTDLVGISVILKDLATRRNGEIIEFDAASAAKEHTFALRTRADMKSFFAPCKTRVDVILDPYCSDKWYPYWEGTRKMAPQFRSKGIGYLRLGDDMSQYGTGFLSCDAGYTFLDAGASTGIDAIGNGSATASSTPYSRMSEDGARGFPSSSGSAQQVLQDIKDALYRLNEFVVSGQDSKWQEHVALLNQVEALFAGLCCVGTGSVDASNPPFAAVFKEAMALLLEMLTKQKNPHALRAALQCSSAVALAGGAQAPALSILWRTVLLEHLALLRSSNKAVADAASKALNAYTSCSDTGKRPLLSFSSACNMALEALSSPANRSAAPLKVLQWFASVVSRELDAVLASLSSGKELLSATTSVEDDTSGGASQSQCVVILNQIKSFLSHKDAATREVSCELLCYVSVINILLRARAVLRSDASVVDVDVKKYTCGFDSEFGAAFAAVSSTFQKSTAEKISFGVQDLLRTAGSRCKQTCSLSADGAHMEIRRVTSAVTSTITTTTTSTRNSPAEAANSHHSQLARSSSQKSVVKTSTSPRPPSSPSKHSPSASSTTGSASTSSTTTSCTGGSELAGAWFEVQLMLRSKPTTVKDWGVVREVCLSLFVFVRVRLCDVVLC